ncbi:MAG TPA: cupredoxin domain-containing protein [Candidatus Bathyarchaeia archaeon]|nr:cupredoxin domain-containing protein [Candidatus Bathyarchaeia archaeon]
MNRDTSRRPELTALVVAAVLLILSMTPILVAAIHFNPVQAPTQAPSVVVIVAPNNSGVASINFAPANVLLVIGVNNTIIMKNADTADHTMTSNPGDPVSFDTGDISGGTSSSPITFTTPGTYAYHCQFHPAYMKGTITVVASGS